MCLSVRAWVVACARVRVCVGVWVLAQLAATMSPGDRELALADPADFREGDHLVLTSTTNSGGDDTEEVVVEEVVSPTLYILQQPVRFVHHSEWYTHDGFAPVDMRAEVGLLTRNIVVQGDEGSTAQLYGAHMAAMHGAALRVQGVEVRRCGQAFVLGRYCTHFHMAGKAEMAYVKDNAIHHSFQRAVTVHATHHALIKNNVAYFVRGHTYFVEVGLCTCVHGAVALPPCVCACCVMLCGGGGGGGGVCLGGGGCARRWYIG